MNSNRPLLIKIAALVWLYSSIPSVLAFGQSSLLDGPIELRNQYFLSQAHLTLTPTTPDLVPMGSYDLRISAPWSNTCAGEDGSFLVDGEKISPTLSIRGSFSPELELGFEQSIVWQGGGILDGSIDSYHQRLGLPRGDRDDVPADKLQVSGATKDGSSWDLSDEGWYLTRPILRAKKHLDAGMGAADHWALEFTAALPSFDSCFGTRGIDGALALLGSAELGNQSRWLALWGAGYLLYGDVTYRGIEYARHRAEGFASIEFRASSSVAVLVGLYSGSAEVQNVPDHAAYQLYLDTGTRFVLSESSAIELLVRENPGASRSSTDITFLVGTRHVWR